MLGVSSVLLVVACAASAQEPGRILPPLWPGLEAVPLPSLDGLEPAVAIQLEDAEAALVRSGATAAASRRALAMAYGSLGRIVHAYDFFEAADASYRNASELSPDESRWLHLRGYLYQQTGRFAEALDLYRRARRADPEDHALGIRLAEVCLALGRLDDARREYEAAAVRYPAAARAGLGEVALREGRFDEAIRHLRGALERVPQAASLHYPMAMALRGLRRMEEARAHLEQRGSGEIRAVDPVVDDLQNVVRGERSLVIQGRRAYEAGEYGNAAELFRRAIASVPDSVAARLNLGLTKVQLGDTSGAIAQFEDVLSIDPANEAAHASLGTLLVTTGDDTAALEHLHAAFAQAPDDRRVSRALSAALVRLRREDEAIGILTEALALAPDDEDATVSLGILLAHRERYRESVALLDEANRRAPGQQATATTLARLLASAPDLSLRNGGRALQLAHEVYGRDPKPVHAETIAIALAELGRCVEAEEWIARAIGDAARIRDDAERARLKAEEPKYRLASCRPPRQ